MTKLKRKLHNFISSILIVCLVLALGILVSGCKAPASGDKPSSGIGGQSGDNGQISGDVGSGQSSSGSLSADDALKIAINHAELSENDIELIKSNLERDDGRSYWEIDFYGGNDRYEYEIDAKSGNVLESQRLYDKKPQQNSSSQSSSDISSDYISKKEAEDKALAYFSLSRDDVRGLELELDRYEKRPHYEVDFYHDFYDYECKVDAKTGEVFDARKEKDD